MTENLTYWDGETRLDLSRYRRIALIGPSSAGKTTLARNLAKKLDMEFVSLDCLHHLPGWQPQSREDFTARHDAAIAGERWVMEGSYRRTMPQRFARADLILFLDVPVIGCAWRFFWRSMKFYGKQRLDAPEGCLERISPAMYHYTLWDYPRRRRPVYHALAADYAEKMLIIDSFRKVKTFTRLHKLDCR